jgi:hypothetical protein
MLRGEGYDPGKEKNAQQCLKMPNNPPNQINQFRNLLQKCNDFEVVALISRLGNASHGGSNRVVILSIRQGKPIM